MKLFDEVCEATGLRFNFLKPGIRIVIIKML